MKQSKSYKALRDKWYNKLKKSGFEDIEDVNSEREMLKAWDSKRFQVGFDPIEFEARARYYQLATEMLYVFNFQNEIDRLIWELHSRGLSLRQISIEANIKVWKARRLVMEVTKAMLGK